MPSRWRYAVEFRDDDWFHDDSYAVLRRHGVALVWVYFINDYDGHAVRNAQTLIRLLGDAARTWPPDAGPCGG